MWISPKFQLLLVKEYQRLKTEEQRLLGWSAKRELSKINYCIHTDAKKQNLVPMEVTPVQASIIYANEADVLNMAMFGMTAKQWREANPELKELDVKTGIGLIEKKRLGLGKPNVIYVKNFMIKDEEGEKQQTEQRQSRIVEIEELQDKRQKFLNDENHNSGIVKIINQENAESEVQNSENHNSGMMKMENQVVSETQLKNSENHNSEKRNSCIKKSLDFSLEIFYNFKFIRCFFIISVACF